MSEPSTRPRSELSEGVTVVTLDESESEAQNDSDPELGAS